MLINDIHDCNVYLEFNSYKFKDQLLQQFNTCQDAIFSYLTVQLSITTAADFFVNDIFLRCHGI